MSSRTRKGGSRVRSQILIDAIKNNPEMPVLDVINVLKDSTDIIGPTSNSLWHVKGSVRTTIPAAVINEAGIDKEDPDSAQQIYLREEGLVIIDLKDNL